METDTDRDERLTGEDKPSRRPAPGWAWVNQFAALITLGRTLPQRFGGGALGVREFRNFWIASIVSNIGSWMQIVAQGWLILVLTDSPFYLGLVGLVRAVPALSVTLIGGVLADRVDRRRVLLFTQTSAGALALALGILDLTGLVTIWQILVISFLSAVVMALDNPARQALVPDLVGKENIASAVGLNSAAWNAAAVIGPSLAGLLVAVLSTSGAFILNGVSYFAVVYAIWQIKPQPRRAIVTQSILQNLIAGLGYIRSDRRIWGILLVLAVPTLLGRPYLQLMPVFARDILQSGPTGYGVLMAASGIGALAGALSVTTLGATGRKGQLLLVMAGLFGASLLLFSGSRWFTVSLVLLLVIGVTQTLLMAFANTLLQLNVPEEMRGRVMSTYTLIPMGLMPAGSMLLGSIGDVTSVPLAVGGGAVIVLVFAAIAYSMLPEVRRLR